MISYAGIGSRSITQEERETIKRVAYKLSFKATVYSGNADGADIAFQEGSEGNCVVFLPWRNFNRAKYDLTKSRECYVVGQESEGLKAIEEFHPAPHNLSFGARSCLCRNYYQICGYRDVGQVRFVVCCANVDSNGEVSGGTGHAVRIAKANNIPVFNIRQEGWRNSLKQFLRETILF